MHSFTKNRNIGCYGFIGILEKGVTDIICFSEWFRGVSVLNEDKSSNGRDRKRCVTGYSVTISYFFNHYQTWPKRFILQVFKFQHNMYRFSVELEHDFYCNNMYEFRRYIHVSNMIKTVVLVM